METFDLVVIGSGPAGEKGAAQAAYFGKRVAVVERAPRPGGAAVHTGTLPSKTLRETAIYLSGYRMRELYGVSVRLDDPRAAVPRLIARKDAIAQAEVGRIRANLDRHRVTYITGEARFAAPDVVEVATHEGPRALQAARFLIATGSIPRRPDDVPMADPDVYDSDEILSLDRLPGTLAILGGGVIGCEYACMFAALGVAVTLVDTRDVILPFLDVEIRTRLEGAMGRLGVRILKGKPWGRIARVESGIETRFEDGSSLVSEKLLFAAGRTGATVGLGLPAIGIQPDARGYLKVNEQFQTSLEHVYAAGDVVGFPCLASVAMEQARVAMCHAFRIGYKQSVGYHLPYGIYTIPEVSCVGETEESCLEKGYEHVAGRALYAENARGQIAGDVEGMTKIVVHPPTRRILGIHVIGERATELVHVGHAVMHLGGTVDTLIEMVFNYPTLSESFKYAAYAALAALDGREPASR